MAYEQKDGSGALFKNDKKGNPNWPDYRGDLMVGGVVYEVAGWIKPVKSNPENRYMSLSAKPKQEREQKPAQRQQTNKGSGFDDMPDDVPF